MTTATTVFAASAPFRTVHHGRFRILVTDNRITSGQHLVLVKGRVTDRPAVACRVASACITSTALDADDCDCAGQNRTALDIIDADGMGVLIHLDQEGRGNGLVAKIRALNGKEAGLDTFTAIEALGLPADNRNYSDVARILHELRVPSIRLLTNNPAKVAAVADTGVVVVARLPCLDFDPPRRSLRHLAAKADRGHLLPHRPEPDAR
ncbi:MAG: GTP cyclohydrolase II [Acidimicrobiia bacterium]|nr:GTP cyclohydrolase II [Acidimicrobiia bacterium]MDH5519717.1 GTP cyclohydrolase II [Acidimicrobiia bacterium]